MIETTDGCLLQNLYASADLRLRQGLRDLIEGTNRGRPLLEERASRLARSVGLDRDASEDLRPQFSCHPLTTVSAEDLELLAAVRALSVAHVLHYPHYLQVGLHRHLARFHRYPRRVG